MSSLAVSWQRSAKAAARQASRHATSRGFQTSSRSLAAQNFTMPALSPTMTEGNISKWQVKEGDSFSAGDVILEVETDKATMDVEAQDDGILAKITQPDGSKGVQVGSRIAVLAEPDDDLSSLEIPADDTKSTKAEEKDEKESSPSQSEAPPASKATSENTVPAETEKEEALSKKSDSKPAGKKSKDKKSASSDKSQKRQNKKYPLYPSVAVLLHRHDISADSITATGPGGRLLKGDVLAYLEAIPKDYPEELSSKLEPKSHLDLSNIKAAPAKEKKATAPAAQKAEKQKPQPVSVTTPISLAAVLTVQKRLQDTLGVTLPLSSFVARAIELANEDLPAKKGPASADELFDSLIGAGNVRASPRGTRGSFIPQIVALPPASLAGLASRPAQPARRQSRDVLDDLISPSKGSAAPVPGGRSIRVVKRTGAAGALSGADNIFSLKVEEAEAARARVFLSRVKGVLESEPGRLVL